MIAVCITTYNHEAFIAQAIGSVLAQVCDEPLRLYIGDDASTDATGTLCAAYAATDARIVYIRREQNMGLVSNTIDLYRRILSDGCEYIAILIAVWHGFWYTNCVLRPNCLLCRRKTVVQAGKVSRMEPL